MIYSHGFPSRFGTTLTGISKLPIGKCYASSRSTSFLRYRTARHLRVLGEVRYQEVQSHVVLPLFFHLPTDLRGPFGRAFYSDRARSDQLCIFGSRPFSEGCDSGFVRESHRQLYQHSSLHRPIRCYFDRDYGEQFRHPLSNSHPVRRLGYHGRDKCRWRADPTSHLRLCVVPMAVGLAAVGTGNGNRGLRGSSVCLPGGRTWDSTSLFYSAAYGSGRRAFDWQSDGSEGQPARDRVRQWRTRHADRG